MFPHPQVPGQLWQERLGQYAELRLAAQVRRQESNPSMPQVIRGRVAARFAPILSGAKS